MKTAAILFVLTSHATIGDGGPPTGVWLEEFTTPYYAFVDAGYEVDVASIQGGVVPIDPKSVSADAEKPASVQRYLKDDKTQKLIATSLKIDGVDGKKYAAVFLPGGHGTMWDLPASKPLAKLVGEAIDDGRVVAAVCHGPAGLVNAKTKDGKSVVAGRKVSGFTNEEEEAVGLTKQVPFLLEDKLKALGGKYEKAPNFQAFAVADGNLVTGQNPASSEKVATLVIEQLKGK